MSSGFRIICFQVMNRLIVNFNYPEIGKFSFDKKIGEDSHSGAYFQNAAVAFTGK